MNKTFLQLDKEAKTPKGTVEQTGNKHAKPENA